MHTYWCFFPCICSTYMCGCMCNLAHKSETNLSAACFPYCTKLTILAQFLRNDRNIKLLQCLWTHYFDFLILDIMLLLYSIFFHCATTYSIKMFFYCYTLDNEYQSWTDSHMDLEAYVPWSVFIIIPVTCNHE